MRKLLIIMFILILNSIASAMPWIDATAIHESGNRPLKARKDTNGVIVLGYFQISYNFWRDATDFDKTIGGTWQRCQYDRSYSALVVEAYMRRYKAITPEEKSRIFNGGPSGMKKKATIGYWLVTKKIMESK